MQYEGRKTDSEQKQSLTKPMLAVNKSARMRVEIFHIRYGSIADLHKLWMFICHVCLLITTTGIKTLVSAGELSLSCARLL